MIEILSQKVAFRLKALAVYQIIFGLMGVGVTIWLIITIAYNSALLLMLCIVPLALYAYSIYCGILIFQKNDNALKHSIINQYFQLINFSIYGYTFKFIAGILFSIGFNFTNGVFLNIDYGLFSTWSFRIATQTNEILINCNLIALTLIILLNNLKKRILLEQELQVLSIGEDVKAE